MTYAHFLKTFMATNVVNLLNVRSWYLDLPLLKIAQVLNIGSSDRFIVAGCFSFLFVFSWLLSVFHYWIKSYFHMYQRQKKLDRNEGVSCAMCECAQHHQKWTKAGLPQCGVPKKKTKKKRLKGLFVYMQCIPLTEIYYLIGAVCKCM